MIYEIIIKPRAIEMAKEAYEWYEEKKDGLGELFLKELDGCYNRIELRPVAYAKIKNNFRQAMLKTFPYVVVFEIHKKEIVVYAVFHTSQSLRKKFKR